MKPGSKDDPELLIPHYIWRSNPELSAHQENSAPTGHIFTPLQLTNWPYPHPCPPRLLFGLACSAASFSDCKDAPFWHCGQMHGSRNSNIRSQACVCVVPAVRSEPRLLELVSDVNKSQQGISRVAFSWGLMIRERE